jgi:hypothetical protein
MSLLRSRISIVVILRLVLHSNCFARRAFFRHSVGTGFGPVAFVAFGLRLGHEAGGLRPPLASPAPTSLACPHAEE